MSGKEARSAPPEAECHLVAAADVLARHGAPLLRHLAAALAPAGMLLLEEPHDALRAQAARDALRAAGLLPVARQRAAARDYLLLRKEAPALPTNVVLEIPEDSSYAWVETLREALKRAESEDMRVYVWSRAPTSGVLGLGTCLRAEPGGRALRVFLLPETAEAFAPHAPAYAEQTRKDLAVNVLRAGVWGSYRHLALPDAADLQLQARTIISLCSMWFHRISAICNLNIYAESCINNILFTLESLSTF